MSITFTGTTDNSNFDYIVNQTTPNYKVIGAPDPGRAVVLRTKNDQKVLFKDESLITTPEGGGTNSPNINTVGVRNSEIVFDSCNILINRTSKQRKVTEGNIKFINSNIIVLPEGDRINFNADKIEGMHLSVRRRTPREQVFLYVNQNTVIQGLPGKPNLFEGLWCIELARGVKIKDTTFKNTGPNLLNWNAGKVSVRGLTLNDGTPKQNSVDCDAWINANNIILFYSCKLRLNHVTGGSDGRASRFICINEKYSQKNLKIKYSMKEEIPASSRDFFNQSVTGDHVTPESLFSTRFLTLEDGKLKKDGNIIPYVDLLTEVTTDVRLNQPTGMFDPTAIVLPNTHKVNWARTMRHPTLKTYTDEIVDQVDDIGATLGTPTIAAEVKLTLDEEYRPIENSGTCAFAMLGEKINVVVNGVMTTQDIYNKWKEFLYTDDGFNYKEELIKARNGILTIKGDITFRANVTAPLKEDHLNQIIVEGNATLNPNVTVAVPYADANNVGSIEISGVKGCTVRIKKAGDRTVIYETPIQKKDKVIVNLLTSMITEPVYITKVGPDGFTRAGTGQMTLTRGVNEPIKMYAGEQVQVTNIDDLKTINKNLNKINGGVKKASMLIPYTDNLESTHDN